MSNPGRQNNRFCTATSKRTGHQCKAIAMNGYNVCRFHGARGGNPKQRRKEEAVPEENLPQNLVHGRRSDLVRRLGSRFRNLMEAPEALKDFQVDNALFLEREAQLAERTAGGDTTKFRQNILMMLALAVEMLAEDRFAELAQQLVMIIEYAEKGVESDQAWEKLLQNSERRVKMAVSVCELQIKEQNTFTIADLVVILGRIMDIYTQLHGADHARKYSRIIEIEVLPTFPGVVGSDQDAPLLVGRDRSGERDPG